MLRDAWKEVSSMSSQDAMEEYITMVMEIDEQWELKALTGQVSIVPNCTVGLATLCDISVALAENVYQKTLFNSLLCFLIPESLIYSLPCPSGFGIRKLDLV